MQPSRTTERVSAKNRKHYARRTLRNNPIVIPAKFIHVVRCRWLAADGYAVAVQSLTELEADDRNIKDIYERLTKAIPAEPSTATTCPRVRGLNDWLPLSIGYGNLAAVPAVIATADRLAASIVLAVICAYPLEAQPATDFTIGIEAMPHGVKHANRHKKMCGKPMTTSRTMESGNPKGRTDCRHVDVYPNGARG